MLLYPQQPLKTRLIRSRELYMTATVLESTWTRGGSAEMLYTHMHGRWYWFPLDVLLTLASNKNPAKTQCEPRAPYHAMTRCVRAGQMRLRRGLPTSLLSTHRCTVSIPYNIHRYVCRKRARQFGTVLTLRQTSGGSPIVRVFLGVVSEHQITSYNPSLVQSRC